jgi:transposase-like protein
MSDELERIEDHRGHRASPAPECGGEAADRRGDLTRSDSVFAVAGRHGVAPNLLYRWRRLMSEGGTVAVQADEGVTGNGEVRRLKQRMRELERRLGRKTLEVEILKEALASDNGSPCTAVETRGFAA